MRVRTLFALPLLSVALGGALLAQDPPQRPPADTAAAPRAAPPAPSDSAVQQAERGDSVRPRPPVTPIGAFLRSLVLPGWGQARLGRNVTGGLFVAFEALAAAMVWKSNWQLEWARTRGKFVQSHKQEREDWIVLLVFNHLFAGAEAFVAAHLWDFPPALRVQRLPDGRAALGVTIPIR